MIPQLLDGTLVLVVVALAWRALNDRDLFRGVIEFIALGLLLAMAWLRLRAPDLALAEAAVGSGLTGALILSALVRMRRREQAAAGQPAGVATGPWAKDRAKNFSRVLLGALSVAMLGTLAWAALSLPAKARGLTAEALARLPDSGVTNPVTAVLLNFRAYDTLLEIGVLLLAIVGVWALRRGEWPAADLRERPLLLSLLRWVLPLLAVGAGYLLWIGASAPGGAFQGGALLAGALVLALLSGLGRRLLRRGRLVRTGLTIGVLVFGVAGAVALGWTGGLLQYPTGQAGAWILVIEAAALVSIGLTLGLLYLGGRPGEK
ncbi:MAG: DUF4040 domain-containing protein [Verrucomicrobia bacterium]|nr:DUF4040 domain-containing protein [Verrucomicrobiota bacterium]